MNGRFAHEDTPEGRLAVVAVMLADKMEKTYQETGKGPQRPDVADLREVLRPFVQCEIIKARIDESSRTVDMKVKRRADLVRALYVLEAQIPKELRT
jgi:hypothetical protein